MNFQKTLSVMLAAVLVSGTLSVAEPAGTAFSYQGQLKADGLPYNGLADLRFMLYDHPTNPSAMQTVLQLPDVEVVNGLFTVQLDFGAVSFSEARWLEIAVRDQGGSFQVLSPRQPITGSPFALYALNAPVTGGDGWWAANGNDIYSLHNGRLGIRTSSPRQHLSIGGNLDLYSGNSNSPTRPSIRGSAADNLVLNATADGAVFINHDGGTGGVRIQNGGGGIDNEVIRITNNGRIGIGVTEPLHQLHVTGPNNISMVYAANNWITIRGIHTSTGTFPGVQGETNSTSNGAAGVRGFVNSTSPGASSAGVWGRNFGTGSNGHGIRGTHDGNGVGVFGEATGSSGWAGHFQGRVRVTGDDVGTGIQSSGTIFASKSATAPGPGASFSRSTESGGILFGPTYRTEIDGNEIDAYTTSIGIPPTSSPTPLRLNRNSGEKVEIGNRLEVYSSGTPSPSRPSIRATNANNLVINGYGSGATYINHDSGSGGVRFHNGTSNGEFARFTPAGRLGLGITAPSGRLGIRPASGEHAMVVAHSDGFTRLMVHSNGNVGVGVVGTPQDTLHVAGATRTNVLRIMGGSDLAERFDVADVNEQRPEPGMVVCIDPANPGKLLPCSTAYDRTVAGIISGANGINSGMIMGQEGSEADGAYPVALTGRVYVKVSADGGPIVPGDMLTSSDRPGHAMKATDRDRRDGAVIGKAMTGLNDGEPGMVLVLVGLQ